MMSRNDKEELAGLAARKLLTGYHFPVLSI